MQTHLFEGIALPTGDVLPEMAPMVFVTTVIVLHEAEIEQGIQVCELIHHIALCLSKGIVAAYEVTITEVV